MSWPAMRAVLDARRDGVIGGGPRFAVGVMLADSTDQRSGEAAIGMRSLARVAGVSVTTACDGVADLIEAGVVDVVQRGIGSRPTRYRFPFSPANAEPVDNDSQRPSDGTLLRSPVDSQRSPIRGQRSPSGAVAFHSANNSQMNISHSDLRSPIDEPVADIAERVDELRARLAPDARQQLAGPRAVEL